MEKGKHTKLPIKILPWTENGSYPIGTDEDDVVGKHIALVNNKRHAETFVKCVNAHDELVEALNNIIDTLTAPKVAGESDSRLIDKVFIIANKAVKKAEGR